MEKLGLVASGSKSAECYVIFEEEAELKHNIVEEDFVVIEDKRTKLKTLGIVRTGRGIDPTIKTGVYGVGTAYVSKGKGDLLSSNRKFFDAAVTVLGEIKDGSVVPNRKWITPGSWVFIPDANPFSYFVPTGDPIEIGHYKDRNDWRLKLNANMITRHVAIYGSTGSGKSHLVRVELIPEIVKKTKFSVLVFDYSGEDYAPYFDDIISVKDLAIDWETMVSKICEECRDFGYVGKGTDNAITNAVFIGVKRLYERGTKNFYQDLIAEVEAELQQSQKGAWLEGYLNKFHAYYEEVDPDELNELFGRSLTAEKIEQMLNEKKVVVVDLSSEEPESRVSAVLSILRYYIKQLKKNESGKGLKVLNRVLVIDEAPQFCPYGREFGAVAETTDAIATLSALGRKHSLGLVLLSQGIKGDAGINAAIRRNINTKFVGKLSPNDLSEVNNEILQSKIEDTMITNLLTGEFYVAGVMSPIGQAILIRGFASKEEKYGG